MIRNNAATSCDCPYN